MVSEGRGADWLRAAIAEDAEPALVLLPFQPYEVLSEVLASADVLLAILEPEAGAFSVPSKSSATTAPARPSWRRSPAPTWPHGRS